MRNAFLHVKKQAISLSLDWSTIFTFDLCGRLVAAYADGQTYRRGLDNRVLLKQRSQNGHPTIYRRELKAEEARAFLDRAQTEVRSVERALLGEGIGLAVTVRKTGSLSPAEALSRILAYDHSALEKEKERFRSVYSPVGILPPDQYLALVLQATSGCAYNHCTFCNFYYQVPFCIKSCEEFRSHIQAVREFFGQSLALRRTLFLGSANALVIPQPQLVTLLEEVTREFPIASQDMDPQELARWKQDHPLHFQGIYSFLDVFTALKKSHADYQELAQLGLRRVYLGLESGNQELLHFLNKPSTVQEAKEAVHTVRAGGLQVGAIVMIGVGGDKFFDRHVQDTVDLLHSLELREGDILYFSEFVERPETAYPALARRAGIRPLTSLEMKRQRDAIRRGLVFPDPSHPPKISVYNIQEFLY